VTALRAALALAFATAVAGCVYFNGLYNAERAYAEVARDAPRLAGALLRRAATSLPGDPYVAVAMGIPGDPRGYEILERELRDELRTLLADVTAAVRERDMLVRPRAEAAAERPR